MNNIHGGGRDPGLYDPDVDWWLQCADAALGLRGTTGSVIAAIERGGVTVGGDHEHVTDEQLGWGHHTRSAPARYRELAGAWAATPSWARGILEVHYATRSNWPKGVQGRLGRLSGVALALCTGDELPALLRACEHGQERTWAPFLRAAERAVREAHEAFTLARNTRAESWATA